MATRSRSCNEQGGDAVMTTRRSRRSEPIKPSAPNSPRVALPKHSGWEFPLSREEKKQRCMYLYENELAAGRADVEQLQASNHEARQALSAKKSTADATVDCRNAKDILQIGASARAVKRARFESFGVGLAVGLGVLVFSWLLGSPVATNKADYAPPLDAPFAPSNVTEIWPHKFVAPNITDRAQGMRQEGHLRLQLSACPEAAWWFSSALQLTEGANVSDHYRNSILGERGFALVCAWQFEEGAKYLSQHLSALGFAGAAHLLNALGYAYFSLQDYQKASQFFELSTNAEAINPVPWNNLGGALLMLNDFQGADRAMELATEASLRLPIHLKEHHTQLLMYNIQVLKLTMEGTKTRQPWIDMWNGYAY